jgi:hypothetical protein
LTSPSPTPTPTSLTVLVDSGPSIIGTLKIVGGSGIVGATITFTQVDDGHTIPVTTPVPTVTDGEGNYQAFPTDLNGDTVTAHYAGQVALAASSGSASTLSGR